MLFSKNFVAFHVYTVFSITLAVQRKKRDFMRKRIAIILTCLTLIALPVYGAVNYASVSLVPGNYVRNSGDVGLSMSAYFHGTNSASSGGPVNILAYAAWSGYPFTLEKTQPIAVNGHAGFTETQSKLSSFYMQLQANSMDCSANGYVKCK